MVLVMTMMVMMVLIIAGGVAYGDSEDETRPGSSLTRHTLPYMGVLPVRHNTRTT